MTMDEHGHNERSRQLADRIAHLSKLVQFGVTERQPELDAANEGLQRENQAYEDWARRGRPTTCR